MLWLAAQTASGEGFWSNLKIEGKLPKNLNETLFRAAPGMSENFGTTFNHLFDGDAYLSAWRFEDGHGLNVLQKRLAAIFQNEAYLEIVEHGAVRLKIPR